MSKRASSSGSSSSNRSRSSGGHKEGWDPSFAVSYPWALPVEDRDEPGKIIGVLCKLCRKHQHNHAGTWTDKPLIGCISNPTNPSPLRTALLLLGTSLMISNRIGPLSEPNFVYMYGPSSPSLPPSLSPSSLSLPPSLSGQTPLHLASGCGSTEVMKQLVKVNADVNVQDSKSGKTALHHSIEKGDLPMTGFLVMEVWRYIVHDCVWCT